MLVNEIFSSIEGEGIRSGYLCTFIRLFGCNLRCGYCDSMYANVGDDFMPMDIDTIIKKVDALGNNRVTVTGGEPLIHKDIHKLLQQLILNGYEVNVETNGSVALNGYVFHSILGKAIYTVDYKSISSGENSKMLLNNLKLLRYQDVLKFVVENEEDLLDMKRICNEYEPHCNIFVSPVFGKIEPVQIVDFLALHNLQDVRIQLQLHKIIWDPNMRGV